MAMSNLLRRYLGATDATRELLTWLDELVSGVGLADGAVTLPKLADGVFAASEAARAKFIASFFGTGSAAALAIFQDAFWAASDAARAKFADSFFSGAVALGKFADGFLTAAKLAFQPVADVGRLGGGTIYFPAVMVAGDTIILSATETWTAQVAPGLPFEFAHGATAANSRTNFITALLSEATSQFRGAVLGGDCCAVWAKSSATVVTLGSAGGAPPNFSQNIAGVTASDKKLAFGRYTVDAVDVATWVAAAANEVNISGAIPSTSAPTLIGSPRLLAASGLEADPANLLFRFVQQGGANEWALVVADPAPALLGVGDVLTYAVLTD